MTKKRLYFAEGWVHEFGMPENSGRFVTAIFKARDNRQARKMATVKIGQQWCIEECTIPQMSPDDIWRIEIYKYNQYEFKKNKRKVWFAKCELKNVMRPIEKGLL